ncbi:DUF3137 domain-containing protein [Shewanella schlegeliana]|uniref:DUF3137 domain-containing protein n=1 Tax=Shewanella schlegeliana TaxID=190308 RepID=A0ABS1SXY4_9GAMM|nr:DUF3137 domain-containing protein [Shewanella schlegeliana]MBL4913388.1 DUF3137 domain-containing protein [Shewanella schlegeliana]MCL1108277.1 DUF3137 domain-containing protein [Shewanella schlegeliana]GIU34624.1 hypothetical protein TUM4433_30970 [Shewanella schlegeliana]
MLAHNAQVTRNIAAIRSDVDAAKSQEDLIALVQRVEQHKGPLDYSDNWYRFFCAISLFFALLPIAFELGLVVPDFVMQILSGALRYSVVWYPMLVLATLTRYFEDKGKRLPIPGPIWGRMLLMAAVGAGLNLIPQWPYWYWDLYFDSLASFLGFWYPSSGFAAHNGVVGVLMLFWLRGRMKWRNKLSDNIFLKDALFNNNLEAVPFEGKKLAKELEASFREFKRGNDLREIQSLYKSTYQGDIHQFDYQLYRFHYVIKRTETTTDANGKTTTRTVRDHYYRHGVLLDFPFASDMSIASDFGIKRRGERYKSASNAFNRQYRVYAKEPMTAARLLSPAIEEKLTVFAQGLKKPVLEFSNQGRLCVAVTDDLLAVKRVHGLDNPKAFAEELAGHTELKQMKQMLGLVHEMMRYSDNNFKVSA